MRHIISTAKQGLFCIKQQNFENIVEVAIALVG